MRTFLLISQMLLYIAVFILFPEIVSCAGKKKKDLTQLTDAEIDKIFDEWNDNDPDEKALPKDEQVNYRPEPPPVDMDILKSGDMDAAVRASKKGRTVMFFVKVSGKPSRSETEEIAGLWQNSLHNGFVEVSLYVIEDDRIMFVSNDGELAFKAKDFLIEQYRCFSVTIEQQEFYGKAHPDYGKKAGVPKKPEQEVSDYKDKVKKKRKLVEKRKQKEKMNDSKDEL